MKLKQKAIRLIFPKTCKNCKRILAYNEYSCNCSNDGIEKLSDKSCLHCANELDNCSCNGKFSVYLDNVAAVYIYNDIIKQQLIEFKFHEKKSLSKYFAADMSKRVDTVFNDVKFDYVSFVPMYKKDFYERGYNQSQLLAKDLSHHINVPFKTVLTKITPTKKQHQQKAKDRYANIKNAFALTDVDVQGKTILICDDIKTTGNTLKSCCDVLLENGAKEVYCICVAISEQLNF